MKERVIYGKHAVLEAIEAGQPIRRVHVAMQSSAGRDPRLEKALRRLKVKVSELPRDAMDRLADGGRHQGIIAVLTGGFGYRSLQELLGGALKAEKNPILVACDQITDPHNLGAIVRSAEAFGARGIILPERRSASVTPVVEKSSAGATAHMPIAQVVNLSDSFERAKEAGYWIVGADAGDGDPLFKFDFARPLILVIGAEGKGMRTRVRGTCDALVNIPTSGKVASLNASVAAGILLYEVIRQRLGAGR